MWTRTFASLFTLLQRTTRSVELTGRSVRFLAEVRGSRPGAYDLAVQAARRIEAMTSGVTWTNWAGNQSCVLGTA